MSKEGRGKGEGGRGKGEGGRGKGIGDEGFVKKLIFTFPFPMCQVLTYPCFFGAIWINKY